MIKLLKFCVLCRLDKLALLPHCTLLLFVLTAEYQANVTVALSRVAMCIKTLSIVQHKTAIRMRKAAAMRLEIVTLSSF